MASVNPDELIDKMKENGVPDETFSTLENVGIKLKSWVQGFHSVKESVNESVNLVKNHPLIPEHIPVTGLVIHPTTGELSVVVDGYERISKSK